MYLAYESLTSDGVRALSHGAPLELKGLRISFKGPSTTFPEPYSLEYIVPVPIEMC